MPTPRQTPDVRPGQVWADNDKRAAGRTIRVDAIDIAGDGNRVAVCTVLTNARNVTRPTGASARIAVHRFRRTSNGYRLVTDAPEREV